MSLYNTDIEEVLEYIFLSMLILSIIVLVIGFIVDKGLCEPVASMKALEYCRNRGYETYIVYEKKIFSKQPLAIVCGTNYERILYEKGNHLINIRGDK